MTEQNEQNQFIAEKVIVADIKFIRGYGFYLHTSNDKVLRQLEKLRNDFGSDFEYKKLL